MKATQEDEDVAKIMTLDEEAVDLEVEAA